MAKERKFYVVWEGYSPGIYDTWEECKQQVDGYPGAKYMSFSDQDEATEAFRGDSKDHLAFARALKKQIKNIDYTTIPEIRLDAVAVDGACAGNPGNMEYRCVRVIDGEEIFHVGPLEGGTNNIGEYLAIIHAASLLKKRGLTNIPIYSDSRTALAWIRNRKSNSKVDSTDNNKEVMLLLERADKWISNNNIENPLLKWDTEKWGEIPADFGRK